MGLLPMSIKTELITAHLSTTVAGLFAWDSTSEGFLYWSKVCEYIIKHKKIKNLLLLPKNLYNYQLELDFDEKPK